MDFSYFSYITGVASLLGFLAQVLDWFPRYKEFRKYALIFLFGIFLGSLSNVFSSSAVIFNIEITGFVLLITLLGLITLSFLLVGIFTSKPGKSDEIYQISTACGVLFIFVLIFGSLPSIENESHNIRNEKSKLTITELNYLSEQAVIRKDFDRALMHLASIKSRLTPDDTRQGALKVKIEKVKESQL